VITPVLRARWRNTERNDKEPRADARGVGQCSGMSPEPSLGVLLEWSSVNLLGGRRRHLVRPVADFLAEREREGQLKCETVRSGQAPAGWASVRECHPRPNGLRFWADFAEPRKALAEVAPVSGDDKKQSADRERSARDKRPSPFKLELRDCCGDEPHPGEQDEEETDFG
jgi:hypothetical protein